MSLILETYRDVRGYRDDESGKFYPSVSAVLDLLFVPKMEWIDPAALDEGTRCHADMKAACDWHMEHGHWPTSTNPRVQALIDCLQEYGFEPIEAERTRCSEVYGHAGTPDAVLRQGPTIAIPDWKFAEGIDQRYRDQVQSYQRFFENGTTRGFLFRVDRECKVRPIPVAPNAQHWTLFLNALACLKFQAR